MRARIFDLIKRLKTLETETEDTGWVFLSIEQAFKAYNDNPEFLPKYRKIGKIVEIRGILTPAVEIVGTSNITKMFTIPSEIRPADNISRLCQGSVKNIWNFSVYANGSCGVSRYGSIPDVFSDIPVGAWLPFQVTYFVE